MGRSHDRRIRYKPNELAAVARHRVTLLVVVGKVPQLARHFIATISRITNFLGEHMPPLIAKAKVYRSSPAELAKNRDASDTVVLWYPKARQTAQSAIVLTP
ncbi:MAG: hypothetical protein ACREV1_05115 [Gammaproteobacteria bacterium]